MVGTVFTSNTATPSMTRAAAQTGTDSMAANQTGCTTAVGSRMPRSTVYASGDVMNTLIAACDHEIETLVATCLWVMMIGEDEVPATWKDRSPAERTRTA